MRAMTIKRCLTFSGIALALLISGAALADDDTSPPVAAATTADGASTPTDAVATAADNNATAVVATATFASCVDARGQTLTAQADATLPELARVVTESGGTSIHYNAGLFPYLSENARMFLYMTQCARHGLGDAHKSMTKAQIRQADCLAVNTLLKNNVITREGLPSLDAELVFAVPEWQQLPGPARAFNLSGCGTGTRIAGDVLSLSRNWAPDPIWNRCTRVCADTLWTCQNAHGEKACMGSFQQCEQVCNEKAGYTSETASTN
jgi:hypothetical protein